VEDRTSGKEARDHYGNILWTEEVIFKEIRLPFQGNFAFPVSFVLFLRWTNSPVLPLQDDYENFAPFFGVLESELYMAGTSLLRINLLNLCIHDQ